MSSRVRFWQNTVCKGAGLVRKQLQEEGYSALRVKQSGSRFRGRHGDLILNWGSQREIPQSIIGNATLLNPPSSVINASNKVKTFRILKETDVHEHILRATEDIEEAREWLESGHIVYCRTHISTSQGRGIVIARESEELVNAPLFTKYEEPSREIRVHVFDGTVIDYAQKKRMNSDRLEEEGITPNEMIRSRNNGFIFARDGVEIDDRTKEVALKAVNYLGLQFGSVDMIINRSGKPVVIEVNTASGMKGTTVERYAEVIKGCLRN